MNPSSRLSLLLPRAIEWATTQAEHIATTGMELSDNLQRIAARQGVQRPDLVRIKFVEAIPLPEDEDLRALAVETGVIGGDTAGLTVGHGIFIVESELTLPLLSHELRHVHQFESLGSISAFLEQYIAQVLEFGYDAAPLELDARAHEITEA